MVNRFVRLALPLGLLALPLFIVAPRGQTPAAPAAPPVINQSTDPLLTAFKFRSIGPASMGGRIDDIAVSESDPNIIYIGYAVGGVFKSDNNGTTFQPVFQTYSTASIGDIAIHPTNPNIVYVGTGEANNRQTTSFGDGIYKTTDGGKTFTHIGLRETQTIARIVIDPKNPDTVFVAAPGHLFGPNPERGIYKTTDGGKTWNKVKFIDDDTGFTDIAIDPSNSNILYASSHQRRRSGCCFNGGGPGSAIWKTTDAGKSWTKLDEHRTSAWHATGASRSTYRVPIPNVLYAQIEAGEVGTPVPTQPSMPAPQPRTHRPAPRGDAARATAPARTRRTGRRDRTGRRGSADPAVAAGAAVRRSTGATTAGRRAAIRPDAAAAAVAVAVAPAQQPPAGLDAACTRSRSAAACSAPTTEVRRWTLMSNCNARPMYFSQLRVDPTNDKTIYVAGLPSPSRSTAARRSRRSTMPAATCVPGHVDQHAIWIDPKNPKHIMIGNDGGLDVSWDQGTHVGLRQHDGDGARLRCHRRHAPSVLRLRRPAGQRQLGRTECGARARRHHEFRLVRHRRRRRVLHRCRSDRLQHGHHRIAGRQHQPLRPADGTRPEHQAASAPGARPAVRAPRSGGGGGAAGWRCRQRQVAEAAGTRRRCRSAAPRRAGVAARRAAERPERAAGDQYRFNWNTPVVMSPHNPKIVWLGGNRLFKSYNQGDTWVASADLTKQIDRNNVSLMGVPGDRTQLSKNDGVVSYSTIIVDLRVARSARRRLGRHR